MKDKEIEILAAAYTVNENGFAMETLQAVYPPVWAYYWQLSGKEYNTANTENVQEEIMFQIDYRNDLTTRHVIHYHSEL